MKKHKLILIKVIAILFLSSVCFAQPQSKGVVSITEEDGDPDVYPWRVKFANGNVTDNGDGTVSVAGGSGAPTDADYLVGTANGSLSAEIVVGTTPGGELGGTWASPTVDTTHSGTAHHDAVTLGTDADVLLGLSTQQITLDSQTANYVFAGPTSGAAADPTFRALVDDDVPDTITVSNYLLTAGTDNVKDTHIDWGTGAGQVSGADITFAEGDMTDSTIVSADIKDGVIVSADLSGTAGVTLAQTAMTAGRSLTIATNDVAADSELFTFCKTLYLEDPVAADDLLTIWVAPLACTITKIHYESDQTVVFDLSNDDGTPTGVNGSDITCTTFATDSSLAGDTTMAAGDRMDLAIASVSGTPTWFSVSWEGTYDD